jgi:hypothetical protein
MKILNEPCRQEIGNIGVGRLRGWVGQTWTLFRSAPLRLMGLALLPVVFEAIVQLIPEVGMVLSKLLTPLASAWVLAMVHQRALTGAFGPAHASGRWRARLGQLLPLALVSSGVFAFQLAAGILIADWEHMVALASGSVSDLRLSRPQMAAILASGIVPATLLMFAPPLVLLSGQSIGRAIEQSVLAVVRYWRPMLIYALVSAALIAGMLWQIWMLLLYLPAALYVGYAAYRDIFLLEPGHVADGDA